MSSVDRDVIPFRWDLSHREQLGQLLTGDVSVFPLAYRTELREIAAMVVARSGDSDLVFVGRSPENMFDYLSGAFSVLKSPPSLTLLQGSFPRSGAIELTPAELESLLGYFRSEGLAPSALATSRKGLRFVDVVWSGDSFRWLLQTIRAWSEAERADWNVVRDRIGFIGLTSRGKNSPNTFRWQQSEEWIAHGKGIFVKNVSVSPELWAWIANHAPKVTPSHSRNRWGSADASMPTRDEDRLRALRGAVQLYDLGRDRDERTLFARALTEQQEMSEPWLRRLVTQLKTGRK